MHHSCVHDFSRRWPTSGEIVYTRHRLCMSRHAWMAHVCTWKVFSGCAHLEHLSGCGLKHGLFYPVPDQGCRQLKAADPRAGRVGYKKAKSKGGVLQQPLQKLWGCWGASPPSRHPQCFSRSTGPRACVLTYVRLCFSQQEAQEEDDTVTMVCGTYYRSTVLGRANDEKAIRSLCRVAHYIPRRSRSRAYCLRIHLCTL